MKRVILICALLAGVLAARAEEAEKTALKTAEKTGEGPTFEPGLLPQTDPELLKHVRFKTTLGYIRVGLSPYGAPELLRHFLTLCESGIYVGTIVNGVERGRWIELGHPSTSSQPVSPKQAALLKQKFPQPKAPGDTSGGRGAVVFLRAEQDSPMLGIQTGRLGPPGNFEVLARVVDGHETLKRIDGVRLNPNRLPVLPVMILEVEVLEPDTPKSPDPLFDQLVEERYARYADPELQAKPARDQFRKTPTLEAPVGQDPSKALAIVLALAGAALTVLARRIRPAQWQVLGTVMLCGGGFVMYVQSAARATFDPSLALGLWCGAFVLFALLQRVETSVDEPKT
ncbi:MAG: peptidylprolyl isomerase [Planctomycetes bacterium]|nr:peptidylprolyl isomerase [Planctomycetota bacterium]